MNQQHPFSDVEDEHGDAGSLGGTAFKRYSKAKTRVTAEGLSVEMCCGECGSTHDVTLEWEELTIAGSNGPGKSPLAPNGWDVDPAQGTLFPNTLLCHCGAPLRPQVTPDECRRHVKAGLSASFIGMPQVQGWSQRADGARSGQPQRY